MAFCSPSTAIAAIKFEPCFHLLDDGGSPQQGGTTLIIHHCSSMVIYLCYIKSFCKTSISPSQRKLEANPLPPLDVLIHLLISKQTFPPSPSGQQKFPLWRQCGYFLEQPILSKFQFCVSSL
jgi:hypothetical protein